MLTGTLFDIKRYAVHDGPGIRTTLFFKGCPLHCWWCHNPEGISPKQELFLKPSRCLEECRLCLTVCPEQALSKSGDRIQVDKKKCRISGICAETCPTGALELVGKTWTVEQVMQEILKDRIFYERSGGGVTFSGGEPLQQPEFLAALLTQCKELGLHTVVDTSGQTAFQNLDSIKDQVDLFFYDLKLMDAEKHSKMTGVSNELILENLRRLSQAGSRIRIRIPLVPGVNEDIPHIRQVAQFLSSLPGIQDISLLPYHALGSSKYKNLEVPYFNPAASPPAAALVAEVRSELESQGFKVRIGG